MLKAGIKITIFWKKDWETSVEEEIVGKIDILGRYVDYFNKMDMNKGGVRCRKSDIRSV